MPNKNIGFCGSRDYTCLEILIYLTRKAQITLLLLEKVTALANI